MERRRMGRMRLRMWRRRRMCRGGMCRGVRGGVEERQNVSLPLLFNICPILSNLTLIEPTLSFYIRIIKYLVYNI